MCACVLWGKVVGVISDVSVYMQKYVYICVYVHYLCMCLQMCVCVCVCVSTPFVGLSDWRTALWGPYSNTLALIRSHDRVEGQFSILTACLNINGFLYLYLHKHTQVPESRNAWLQLNVHVCVWETEERHTGEVIFVSAACAHQCVHVFLMCVFAYVAFSVHVVCIQTWILGFLPQRSCTT